METYQIGTIIREERERRGISQEELCYGICAVVTLSRIENGIQKPSLKVEEALLERLGHSTANLVFYANADEARKHKLEQQIHTHLMHWEKAEDLLEEYRKLIKERGTGHNLEKQFVMMAEAIQRSETAGAEQSAVRADFERALLYTIPEYQEECLNKIKLITGTEMLILNGIALTYAREDKLFSAIRIFDYLVGLLEKQELNVEVPGKLYPVLVHNMVKLFDKLGRHSETKEYADKGIRYCIKFNRMVCFPELLYYKGHACAEMHEVEEAEKYYRQAVNIFEAMGRKDAADFVREKWRTCARL